MVDTIKFSEMDSGGDIDNNKTTPGLKDGGNVLFNNPWTFLPSGTTAERPPITADIYFRLRFNTALVLYEYYDSIDAAWVQLTPATGTVLSVTGTTNQVSVNNTDPQNPILFLPNDVDFPMTFTVQNTVVINEIIDDDTFATATDTNLPTSESVKAYVDAQVGGSVTSGQGTQFQVLVNGTFGSQETGDLIFSLPQDIDTSASPTFVDLTLFGGTIFDENGNTLLYLSSDSDAVNYLQIDNSSTELVFIRADGADSDIQIDMFTKGDSGFTFSTASVTSDPIRIFNGTASQHSTVFRFANTAQDRVVTFQDADGTLAFLSDIPVVNSGLINELAWYAAAGTTISGLATANSSVLITSSGGVPSMSGALTNGQLIVGSTGATPTAATITAGTGVSVTNGAGSITIASTGGGTTFTEVTGTSQAMSADSGYVSSNAGLVTLTLPVTAAFGTVITVVGKGAGGWSIAQNSGQNIQVGNQTTTTGAGGSLASTNRYDSIDLVCTTANNTWTARGAPQSAGLTFV